MRLCDIVQIYNKSKDKSLMQFYKDVESENIVCWDSSEDFQQIIDFLRLNYNKREWYIVWSIILKLPSSEEIIEFCRKTLQEHKKMNSVCGDQYLLTYLFKNMPNEANKLMDEYLLSDDIHMKFASAEFLANTDFCKAIEVMLDIFESEEALYEHSIVDAIEIWITERGTDEIIRILQKRIEKTEDEDIKRVYLMWKDKIEKK